MIENSDQLRSVPTFIDSANYDLQGSIYFYEPFYQLMRQTLWAEQMIQHKAEEDIKADHYLHIHIIPRADTDLLDKEYRPAKKNNMEKTWRACIVDQSKYQIVDPHDFMLPIKDSHPDLWKYLSTRYFNV